MSLLLSPSSSPLPSPRSKSVESVALKLVPVASAPFKTPIKVTSFRNVDYLFDETGKITNFDERDLMRGNKASKMADNNGFKTGRELQYFLPYSISNIDIVEKYGDRPFYYYKPKNVVVYHLPLLKKRLGGISNLPKDDFDEQWYRIKISDNEETDTLFFTKIQEICQEKQIDGVYSPKSHGMHEEVILFYPEELMRQSRLTIYPLFKL